jgi:hypothetical protein
LAVKRGPYKQAEKALALKEIRRLIIDEGMTNSQIAGKLNVSQRTIERYVRELYSRDSELLISLAGDEQALIQLAIARDRLIKQRQDVLKIANSESTDYKTRISAHHLAGDLAILVARIHLEAPSLLARRHRFPNTPLTARGATTTGLNLVLEERRYYKQQPQQAEEDEKKEGEEYDELDILSNKEEEEEKPYNPLDVTPDEQKFYDEELGKEER